MYFELESSPWEKYGVQKWPELPDGAFGFQSGDLITVEVTEPVKFIVDNTAANPPTDFVTSFMPVFSDSLISAFRKSGIDNLQTFKALLYNPETNEKWDEYQVVNILGKIACADMENSKYKHLIGDDYNFSKLVIDVEKAHGALMFRLLESHDKIIIHNDVLDYLYDENDDPIFRGLEITAIDSSRDMANTYQK